ncbi:MAG TPA: DndE family protein [Savagea sp.]
MNFRLKTSEQTGKYLQELQSRTGLRWNALARLAVAYSLRIPTLPKPAPDTHGVEIHRNALTGEHDYVYKALIRQHAGEHIPEEDYFPNAWNAHLERGISKIYSDYVLAGNVEQWIETLLKER